MSNNFRYNADANQNLDLNSSNSHFQHIQWNAQDIININKNNPYLQQTANQTQNDQYSNHHVAYHSYIQHQHQNQHQHHHQHQHQYIHPQPPPPTPTPLHLNTYTLPHQHQQQQQPQQPQQQQQHQQRPLQFSPTNYHQLEQLHTQQLPNVNDMLLLSCDKLPGSKQIRKRAFSKRSKTGCLTCRERRIKCDETRPICKNCVKSKRTCRFSTLDNTDLKKKTNLNSTAFTSNGNSKKSSVSSSSSISSSQSINLSVTPIIKSNIILNEKSNATGTNQLSNDYITSQTFQNINGRLYLPPIPTTQQLQHPQQLPLSPKQHYQYYDSDGFSYPLHSMSPVPPTNSSINPNSKVYSNGISSIASALPTLSNDQKNETTNQLHYSSQYHNQYINNKLNYIQQPHLSRQPHHISSNEWLQFNSSPIKKKINPFILNICDNNSNNQNTNTNINNNRKADSDDGK